MNSIACADCGKQNLRDARFCTGCGMPLVQPQMGAVGSHLTPGTQLRERYIIVRPLGQGGFGKTYLAQDTGRFNEQVVLKELTPSNQGTYALQKAEELFQREAAMLHKLQHPQIPRFWEFFRDGRRLFLVQDYIEGQTYQSILENKMALGQTFNEAEMIQLLQQLLPVLSYLHTSGIIHRDIAPDNIIRRACDGLPVLIDFGGVTQIPLAVEATITYSQRSTLSTGGTRLGKIGYAPDEQLRLGIVAPHSDLYALGVTALVLMTAKQPQDLIDVATMQWNWQHYLSLSPILTEALNRMLASQPIDRFQSADELLQYLDTQRETAPTHVYSRATYPQSPTRNSTPAATHPSGQGHLFDPSVQVPDEIQGWNWGAFFLPGFWCITNRVWIGLISWADLSFITIPFTLGMTWPVMAVLLGVKGNEWAWKSRRWKSIKAFRRHQRLWAIAGFMITGAVIVLIGLVVLAILVLGVSLI